MGDLSSFLDAFGASGPDPALADRLHLFGQFVGSWDLDVASYDAEGNATHTDGEWHFGWALAGRAVADVWICPRRAPDRSSPGEHGLSIRFFDELLGAWRSTWIGPHRRLVRAFVARGVDDRIVLEGSFEPGVTTRLGRLGTSPSRRSTGATRSRATASRGRWRRRSRPAGWRRPLSSRHSARREVGAATAPSPATVTRSCGSRFHIAK